MQLPIEYKAGDFVLHVNDANRKQWANHSDQRKSTITVTVFNPRDVKVGAFGMLAVHSTFKPRPGLGPVIYYGSVQLSTRADSPKEMRRMLLRAAAGAGFIRRVAS